MLRGTLRLHARCAASGSAAAPSARSVAPRRAHGGARRPVRRSAGEGEGAESSRDDVVKEARFPQPERGSSRHPLAPPRCSLPRAAPPAAPHCARTALTLNAPPTQLAAKLLDDSPVISAELVALAKAEARVAAAQAAMAEFEAQLAGSSDAEQAQAAAERGADADVVSALAALDAAEARLQQATALRQEAQAAAGPLGGLLSSGGGASKWAQPVDDGAERIESAKAAAAAGAAGAFAAAPLAAASSSGSLDLAVVFASCALFGVVYRYAVRRDLGNAHLKGGVVASFGLVRGLAQAQLFLATAAPQGAPSFEQAAQAALLTGEAVVTFGLAAAAVEACFSRGLVSTFPVDVKTRA